MPRPWCRIALLLAACAVPAAARAQAAAAPCADSARADTAGALVVIRASVTAAEVTFRAQPDASARVDGCAAPAVRVLERRNLPERVQPGVTYRDVHVAVEIVGRVEAACLAALAGDAGLAAALGGGACAPPARADTATGSPPP
ncbi:MAG TPA: hypothetical protein VFJ82_26370 [Longimicrobium sp.]|nr:hypothetical protein [Longimicrobium sp.]